MSSQSSSKNDTDGAAFFVVILILTVTLLFGTIIGWLITRTPYEYYYTTACVTNKEVIFKGNAAEPTLTTDKGCFEVSPDTYKKVNVGESCLIIMYEQQQVSCVVPLQKDSLKGTANP